MRPRCAYWHTNALCGTLPLDSLELDGVQFGIMPSNATDTILRAYNAVAISDDDVEQAASSGRYRFGLIADKVNLNGVVIDIAGMDTARYESNPVVLFNHDRDRMPIGKGLSVVKKARSIDADIQFDEEDLLAAEVKRKVDGGYMRAVSIGFRAISVEELDSVTYPPWNDLRIKQSSLSEISLVTIPADPAALRKQAEGMGLIRQAEYRYCVSCNSHYTPEEYESHECLPRQQTSATIDRLHARLVRG